MLKDLTALFAPQNRRLIKLTTVARDEQELLLEKFTGTEGLSELFSFELSMLSRDAGLALKSQIGQPAQLAIELATGEARYINGYISTFSLQGSDGGLAHYSATLSPWLWMLSRRINSRIFQEHTIEAVIRTVFSAYGVLPDFEFQLSQPLKTHSYITQYRESDLTFVLRLLEHEGLFFYFEHDKEKHTLIILAHHEREETPKEARDRIENEPSAWGANSYHSGLLRSPENHRWVTAMDIAIGQAKCLDDPAMRDVLVAIADWKIDKKEFEKIKKLPGWGQLSSTAKKIVKASYVYYQEGTFPSADLIPLVPPPLILNSSTKGEIK